MTNDAIILVKAVGEALDLVGVVIILLGAVLSSVHVIKKFLEKEEGELIYKSFRKNLGRSILMGLEFLVAGDIIRTVAGTPTFNGIIGLAVIVLIRTFLSITFEMEIEGRWPWQKKG